MYSAIDLKELGLKPKINDITLKVLSEYYEFFLHPFIYHYRVSTSVGEKNIELRFDLDKFCHLLGIESTVKYTVPRSELQNYKGYKGWENVTNLIFDMQHLKRINQRKFKEMKAKYVYFYLLPRLIDKPKAVNYDINKVKAATSIECEILFYSEVENDNAIIHLGIEKDISGYYFPRTFFVEKLSQTKEDIYISDQEDICVKVNHRTILQSTINKS